MYDDQQPCDDERVRRLEQEIRELRQRLNLTAQSSGSTASYQELRPKPKYPYYPQAILSLLLGAVGLMLIGLYPPWNEVKWKKKQVLYWSEKVAVLDQGFYGYDFLFSGHKWKTTRQGRATNSGGQFVAIGYQIHWPLLVVECILWIFAVRAIVFETLKSLGNSRSLAAKRVDYPKNPKSVSST